MVQEFFNKGNAYFLNKNQIGDLILFLFICSACLYQKENTKAIERNHEFNKKKISCDIYLAEEQNTESKLLLSVTAVQQKAAQLLFI
jgi:hypothetical protein